MPIKKGVLSKKDKAYIDHNHIKMSFAEMGAQLNRTPEIIERYVLEQGGVSPGNTLMTSLRSRPEWKNFQLEFTAEELHGFEYHYLRMMRQFGDDELRPTEEDAIFDYIKCVLLITRNLTEQKRIYDEGEELRREQAALTTGKAKNDSKHDARLKTIENRLLSLAETIKQVQARNNLLESRKNQIVKDLKGTRDQRVKLVEGSKHSFPVLLKFLMEEDVKNAEIEQLNLIKLATDKERERLARPYTFADGFIDQPILTSETITDDYNRTSV